MPKVSVIIPTYNRSEILKKSIGSVINQTFEDFELLVMDDGSDDNTQEVVRSFADKRILYARNESNLGVVGARNKAVSNSNGEYIAFLDDDDIWMPDKLERQTRLMEQSPSSIGAIYTGFYTVDDEINKIVKVMVPRYRGNILEDILYYNFIATSTVLIKRECFEKTGLFDEKICYGEDFDMWIRVLEEYEFDYIKDPLVRYLIHPDRITTNYGAVIKGLEEIMNKHKSLFSLNNKAYSTNKLRIGIAYCMTGDTKAGRKEFFKALKSYPFDTKLFYNIAISLFGPFVFKKIIETKESILSSTYALEDTGK